MWYAAPGTVRLDDRPPVAADIAPSPGAACRIPAQSRYRIAPRLLPGEFRRGLDPSHPYVRTYWTALVGKGAVAGPAPVDRRRPARGDHPPPLYLPALCREGLAHHADQAVWVRGLVPPLGRVHLPRLPLVLRKRHRRDLTAACRPNPPADPDAADPDDAYND